VAGTWINQCRNNHPKCARNLQQWYPTRLLQIDRGVRKVKLIISKIQVPNSAYVTLSHRWPKVMPVKLLSSNTAQFQSGIEISELPKIFQDAISITYHLGFHYLWIDSLCIQQDEDFLDWEMESQRMDKVYSNAFLNLSATMASTGSEMLLQCRQQDPTAPSKVKLLKAESENYYITNARVWKDEIDHAPLNHRAWVFQERFLANRILHFGSSQLAWECCEQQALELFPEGLHQYTAHFSNSKPRINETLVVSAQALKQIQPREPPPMPEEGDVPRMENKEEANKDKLVFKFIDEYHQLVQTYTTCHLTWNKDKLIAFSGIPKKISEITGIFDDYVAGMWHLLLPFNLNWKSEEDSDDEDCRTTVKDPSSFSAPSWSWASSTRPVVFPSQSQDTGQIFIADWSFSEQVMLRTFRYVDSSVIHLKGALLSLQIEWSDEEGLISFKTEGLEYTENELLEPAGPLLDIDGSEKEVAMLSKRERIWWLPLIADKVALHGIILTRIPRKSNTYRRLGRIQVPILSVFQYEIGPESKEFKRANGVGRPVFDPLNKVVKRQNDEEPKGQALIDLIRTRQDAELTLR
jgi:Heterokaryon incompatibility protein (HET)